MARQRRLTISAMLSASRQLHIFRWKAYQSSAADDKFWWPYLFLGSPECFLTGQTLQVDGGTVFS